jgi:hypothetical protein
MKRMYLQPELEIISLAEQTHLLAGSVRNDGKKIFDGDPDPSSLDEGNQDTHPADGKYMPGWSIEE